jgi:hypothetical protein
MLTLILYAWISKFGCIASLVECLGCPIDVIMDTDLHLFATALMVIVLAVLQMGQDQRYNSS